MTGDVFITSAERLLTLVLSGAPETSMEFLNSGHVSSRNETQSLPVMSLNIKSPPPSVYRGCVQSTLIVSSDVVIGLFLSRLTWECS